MTVRDSEKRSGEAFNVLRDDVAAASILTLVDLAWERLTSSLTKSAHLTDQARFRHEYLYPQIACREALINAIAHRNYAIDGRGIELSLFPDRLEITSPGSILSTISLDEIRSLKGKHESRNPLICRVLKEIGVMREMGEGIRRIFDVMRSNALAEPEIESDNSSFSVTLYHKSLYDPAVKVWLSQFESFKLTENQRAVLALGFNNREFSTQDIVDRLGLVDMDEVRKLLTPLRHSGLLLRSRSKNEVHISSKRLRIPAREVPTWRVRVPSTETQSVAKGPITDGAQRASYAANVVPDTAFAKISEADIRDEDKTPDEREISLFVANLHYAVTRAELYALLSEYVEIAELKMPLGTAFGSHNRGYAFAIALSSRPSTEVVQLLDGLQLRGRRVHVRLQNATHMR